MPKPSTVIGVDRKPPGDQAGAADLAFIGGDLLSRGTYEALAARIGEAAELSRTNCLFYLATPPRVFLPIVKGLKESGLSRAAQGWRRIVVEKPLGSDLRTARALERLLRQGFREGQVFRMDHFLGKEAVQGMSAFRFGSKAFEPIWNREFVDHVRISADSSDGVEGRGETYDSVGVVRDMIQNHLLQVLCLAAMEPPASDEVVDVNRAKTNLLRSIKRPSAKDFVLGQYRGYKGEGGVSKTSETATFVSLRLGIDNARWRGVPFYLRAGLRMADDVTEVGVAFKKPSGRAAEKGGGAWKSVRFRISPNPEIALSFQAGPSGDATDQGPSELTFRYPRPERTEYELLLSQVLDGDQRLFTSRSANFLAWEIVDPVLRTQRREGGKLVRVYEPGSRGPGELGGP